MKKKIFNLKFLIITLLSIFVIGLTVFIFGYNLIFNDNFTTPNNEKCRIFIRENDNFVTLTDTLFAKGFLKNRKNFENYAQIRHLDDKIKVGSYIIKSGMTNRDFFNIVCNGLQTPVQLKFNNIRFKEQLCGKISQQVNIDSAELINCLNNSDFLAKYDFTPQNILAFFIPNTYEVYWTISAEQFFERMNKEYRRFWNDERRKKAEEINLTPVEVAILASIVDEETNKKSEKPIVSGLYINRLRKGMLLQADPTARYAYGDFSVTQIINDYTRIDSPFNTYIYAGLPPAPIRMATIDGIDAVLNYQHHDYIYMCAKPELNGEH
ncbi:MAG: endolytic transglycosylase MltG, partial [Prevotellaceae bacterium]|nr:endolytic transglycosylase MltG [Prevotellaceae bacterium]